MTPFLVIACDHFELARRVQVLLKRACRIAGNKQMDKNGRKLDSFSEKVGPLRKLYPGLLMSPPYVYFT